MTGSTLLSDSPSLDFDCCSGADADADADAGAGAGAGAVADTVNADTDTAGEDAAAPAVPVEFGASRAINAGPGVGPMSMESNQLWAGPPQISMFLWVLGRMMDACLVQTVPYWWSAIKP